MKTTAVVVTTISAPTPSLLSVAKFCEENDWPIYVIGDEATPPNELCTSLISQRKLPLRFPHVCPTKNYSRKNIGYLMAMMNGADTIWETDDDIEPILDFYIPPTTSQAAFMEMDKPGWFNIYRFFCTENIWPRGFPLSEIRQPAPGSYDARTCYCPIRQGLIYGEPDVDAVYRLTRGAKPHFKVDGIVVLGKNIWCPFNSRNTTWSEHAFPLLYLPSLGSSYRMDDIWRSFIAQRILWANDWYVLYHSPTVRQERNQHDLMKDFRQEIDGYVLNEDIAKTLEALDIPLGQEHLTTNLRLCYEALTPMCFAREELRLLDAWILDCEELLG